MRDDPCAGSGRKKGSQDLGKEKEDKGEVRSAATEEIGKSHRPAPVLKKNINNRASREEKGRTEWEKKRRKGRSVGEGSKKRLSETCPDSAIGNREKGGVKKKFHCKKEREKVRQK